METQTHDTKAHMCLVCGDKAAMQHGGYPPEWCDKLACYQECQRRNNPRVMARRARREEQIESKRLPFYIVAYGISRQYGGPEEGGWWYDWTEIHEVHKVWTFRQARELIRKLQEEYPKPRYSRGSSLGGQDQCVCTCADENEFPEETTGVPRWE